MQGAMRAQKVKLTKLWSAEADHKISCHKRMFHFAALFSYNWGKTRMTTDILNKIYLKEWYSRLPLEWLNVSGEEFWLFWTFKMNR